jgi:amino acid transporter
VSWLSPIKFKKRPTKQSVSGPSSAYWSSTAWTSFVASNTQGTTNYILSELTVFNKAFPGGLDPSNIKFRAVQWAISEVFLVIAIASNLISPRKFAWIFKASAIIIALDLLLTVVWLPIGVSKTYGFQSAKWVFTQYENGTGSSSNVWAFMLAFLSTSGVLTGWDASGHIAEETKNASVASARGMFWSCVASAVLAFPLLLLFEFCSPDIDTLFSITTPQPFVIIYQLALGKGGQLVMTIVATVGLLINTSLAVTAASRLIFAIARDGILPGSKWIGKVDQNGQPRNAILFIGFIAAILLCTILPSAVAFTSLISCGGVPTIAAYALIPVLRLLFTRGEFANAKWSNGRFSVPFCFIAAAFNRESISCREARSDFGNSFATFFCSLPPRTALLAPRVPGHCPKLQLFVGHLCLCHPVRRRVVVGRPGGHVAVPSRAQAHRGLGRRTWQRRGGNSQDLRRGGYSARYNVQEHVA